MEYLLVSLYNSDTYIWFCAKDKLKRKDKLIKLKHTIKHTFVRNCQCTGLALRVFKSNSGILQSIHTESIVIHFNQIKISVTH